MYFHINIYVLKYTKSYLFSGIYLNLEQERTKALENAFIRTKLGQL